MIFVLDWITFLGFLGGVLVFFWGLLDAMAKALLSVSVFFVLLFFRGSCFTIAQ